MILRTQKFVEFLRAYIFDADNVTGQFHKDAWLLLISTISKFFERHDISQAWYSLAICCFLAPVLTSNASKSLEWECKSNSMAFAVAIFDFL